MKKAILNIADTGALESTAHMLESIGYECRRPDNKLIGEIRNAGLEGVYSIEELVQKWGYDYPNVTALATCLDMENIDLFVDVKAHTNYERIVGKWPNLRDRVLWCCLNGGDPTKRKDGLPWSDPPCPTLTNNQWYVSIPDSYVCYPPYIHYKDSLRMGHDGPPLCLVHNVMRWGYGGIVESLSKIGVKFYGGGDDTPNGLLTHKKSIELLEKALCMVYCKVGDTVGYAVLEAMSIGCPLVCTEHYIQETRQHWLLEPNVTCLTFNPQDPVKSVQKILTRLSEGEENAKLGEVARKRLGKLMWNKERDGEDFKEFMTSMYGA